MIVYPPAHDTLPVHIFTLMANSPEQVIAALCVIMVVITCLPLSVLVMVTRYMR
jgi:iron(III) transport system permease protein